MQTLCVAALLLPAVYGFGLGTAPPSRPRPVTSSSHRTPTAARCDVSMSSRPEPARRWRVKEKVVVRRKAWVPVLQTIDLSYSDVIPVEAEGRQLLIVNDHHGNVHACDVDSPFLGLPLFDSHVDGDAIVCPFSGTAFSLHTGEPLGVWLPKLPLLGPVLFSRLCPPKKLEVFPARVVGREIEVYVDRSLVAYHENSFWSHILDTIMTLIL